MWEVITLAILTGWTAYASFWNGRTNKRGEIVQIDNQDIIITMVLCTFFLAAVIS